MFDCAHAVISSGLYWPTSVGLLLVVFHSLHDHSNVFFLCKFIFKLFSAPSLFVVVCSAGQETGYHRKSVCLCVTVVGYLLLRYSVIAATVFRKYFLSGNINCKVYTVSESFPHTLVCQFIALHCIIKPGKKNPLNITRSQVSWPSLPLTAKKQLIAGLGSHFSSAFPVTQSETQTIVLLLRQLLSHLAMHALGLDLTFPT